MAYRARPAVERRSGIQITPTMTSRTTSARGMKSMPRGPFTIPVSQSAEPPPGDFRTTSAAPAQTNDMASVTTMSGTRVMTTSVPLMMPRMRPRTSTPRTTGIANASDWSFMSDGGRHAGQGHHRADRQVDAAGDDDDGLGDRRERERHGPDGEALELRGAVLGLDEVGQEQDHGEQPEQGQRPGVALRPVAQPRRHVRALRRAGVHGGAHADTCGPGSVGSGGTTGGWIRGGAIAGDLRRRRSPRASGRPSAGRRPRAAGWARRPPRPGSRRRSAHRR